MLVMKNLSLDSYSLYKFEHFFELSPDLLCIAGFDGYWKRINPSVSRTLGYSVEELTSRPITSFVHPEDKLMTDESRENLTESTPLINFENRYITKDGRIVWLSWTSMPVEKEKLIYAIAKNITYKKKLEEERNQQLANLTKSHQDLKQLSYATSHDLRSPINNLLSLVGLLDDSKVDDPEILQYLTFLKSSAENLSDILNNSVDILTQKDQLNIQIEELNLNQHLNSVLGSIQSILEGSNVSIKADFSELETIKFNRNYMESILLNLITNSIKYARSGVPPLISIYSRKSNGLSQLIISDNGMGFDMEKVRDKVFGLNQKFHDHPDSKGIGLYLVYNHITSLGGRISLDSKINEGATFTITFRD
ncbi:MAG: PAS domain-containing sensor histidine kinase [Sphingobacteriales bacterium 17-39-43]|nr:MAG: PAS domain-containing sensor histidine kinase [Sphingobacteriales bacterium 16-39-50]OZA24515.1 MAG: PAS domain-containing sensor histidine kinase [Sphingobacteriales bacterium 17-39-43]